MKNKIFAILGGDRRSVAAAKVLSENFETRLFGFDETPLRSVMKNADFALLPIPLSRDNIHLFAPFSKTETPLSAILDDSDRKTRFFGANIPETFKDGKHVFTDLFERDDIQVLNAVPTAEGAIAEAIMKTEHTIWNSECLIFGFGRIGKALAFRLKSLGAKVTVSARKARDKAEISAFGLKNADENSVATADIIFNTVPVRILDGKLSAAKNSAIIFDLADGFDLSLAKGKGINAERLLSLPGKTAPFTAGKIIAETVLTILKGGEEK